jgi:hypothetical protein
MRLGSLSLCALVATAGCSSGGLMTNDMAVPGDFSGGADHTIPTGGDLAMQPAVNNGTKVVSGVVDFLQGVTDDNYIIYVQGTTLSGSPIAGGTAKTIDTNTNGSSMFGNVVFSFSAPDTVTNQVTLTSWTSTQGPKVLSTNTAGVAVASSDGTRVAYLDNVTTNGFFTDVMLANTDGTNPVTLLKGVTATVDLGGCVPEMRFAGTRLFVAHCPDPGDAGLVPATLTSYLAADGTGSVDLATTLQTNASGRFFFVDDAGAKVAMFDNTNALLFTTADGTGGQVPGDTTVLDGYLLKDGSAAVYISAANSLKRATTAATPVVTSLGPTTAQTFPVDYATGSFRSPDDKWLVWSNMSASGVYDLNLSSTQTAGTAVALAAMPTAFISGDSFTSDSSRALYFTDLDMNMAGTLTAMPTAAGGTAKVIAMGGWEVFGVGGTKIVYEDNATPITVGTNMLTRTDLHGVDLAGTAAAKVIATQIEPGPAFTKARDKVVYLWKSVQGMEGIYVSTSTP